MSVLIAILAMLHN